MKVWELRAFGIENLQPAERPDPQPGPGEILVKIEAVSLNYRDFDLVQGKYNPDLKFPATLVSDAASKVVGVGPGVTRFRVGDRVVGCFRQKWIDGKIGPETVLATLGTPLAGMLAEYAVLPEAGAVLAPPYLSAAEAACLPIAAVTAWFALINDGQLEAGQTVVAQGTGGVSLFAAQIAHALGARVIVTSASDEKLARAQQLGPFEVINYKRQPDWHTAVLELTNGRGADHILEVVGGDNFAKSLDALAVGGHMGVIGFLDGKIAKFSVLRMIRKMARIHGIACGHRRAFEEMNSAFEKRHIHPVIDGTYSFAQVPDAFRHLERGAFGKVVIAFD